MFFGKSLASFSKFEYGGAQSMKIAIKSLDIRRASFFF